MKLRTLLIAATILVVNNVVAMEAVEIFTREAVAADFAVLDRVFGINNGMRIDFIESRGWVQAEAPTVHKCMDRLLANLAELKKSGGEACPAWLKKAPFIIYLIGSSSEGERNAVMQVGGMNQVILRFFKDFFISAAGMQSDKWLAHLLVELDKRDESYFD